MSKDAVSDIPVGFHSAFDFIGHLKIIDNSQEFKNVKLIIML